MPAKLLKSINNAYKIQMNTSVLIGIPCLKVGGTEIQTLHLVEALTNGGYHCVTVCYFEYDFAMVQAFEQAGSRVVCLSAYGKRPEGSRKVYNFLKTGLKRVVDEYRPKIAHIQYMAPGAIPVYILHKLGLKTIIATLHTDASIYKSLKLIHFLQRHIVNIFTCVTEIAERSFFGSSCLYTNDYQLKKHNHITIHNCLSGKFEINYDNSKKTKATTIGVVARLESIKGTDLVIPAFAKILNYNPDCRLMIVGDGKLRELMEQQQQQLNIANSRIEWVGQVAYEKLHELYKQMDIVWVPSRSEGFGLSAIEAMAQGCVVIASDTGGLREVVNDSNDGILFHTGNADDMAEKTIELLNTPEKMQLLRDNALKKINQFRFEHYSGIINSLYSKLQQ